MNLQSLNSSITGQFLGQWTTGVIGAALALDATIASMWVPTANNQLGSLGTSTVTRKAFVTGLWLRVSSTVAFTAIQQFGLYLDRFTGGPPTGGTQPPIFQVHTNNTVDLAQTSVIESGTGGDFRVATTAALGVAGVSFRGQRIPVYAWTAVGPADYPYTYYDFSTMPIRLGPNEGLALKNLVVWPAAGTAIVSGVVSWVEATF